MFYYKLINLVSLEGRSVYLFCFWDGRWGLGFERVCRFRVYKGRLLFFLFSVVFLRGLFFVGVSFGCLVGFVTVIFFRRGVFDFG